MAVLRVLVADQDLGARERLRRLVVGRSVIDIVAEVGDGQNALRALEAGAFDVVFLDANLPVIDAFSIASAIPSNGPVPIFLVGDDLEMKRVLGAAELPHVTKPVTMQRIEMTLARVKFGQAKREIPQSLIVGRPICVFRNEQRYEALEASKLAAVLRHENVSILVSQNSERFCDEAFERWVSRLSPTKFVRVHNNALVNHEYVKFLEYAKDGQEYAVLSDKAESRIPIDRTVVQHLAGEMGRKSQRGAGHG